MIDDYYSKIHKENENNIEADERWKQIFIICEKYNNLSQENKKIGKYKKIFQ